jgi:hypothetical protein
MPNLAMRVELASLIDVFSGHTSLELKVHLGIS